MGAKSSLLASVSQHFQQSCLLCHLQPAAQHKPICADCDRDLPWLGETFQRYNCQIHAACHYVWPVDRLIHLYKYQQRLDLLPLLSHLLLKQPKPKVHALVAAPMSPQRLKTRGYNQALLLAQQLSKQWDIPVWQPLARLDRPAQQTLSGAERLQNMRDVFYEKPNRSSITPRHIMIIDDVVTTGSTLFHLSEALQQLGVRQCESLVIAKAE
jgi:ComF family protein